MTDRSDLALLHAWREGDRAAGSALLNRHFDAVYRFFRHKVEAIQVEDLVQRTFLGCAEGAARFRGDSSFKTYLFQVARYQLYGHYRERRQVAESLLGTLSIRDLGTSPTGMLARRDRHSALLSALSALPLDLQIAIELRYWEGFTEEQIADVLEAPRGTIAGRLRRAHGLLREALEREAVASGLRTDPAAHLDEWAHSLRDMLAELGER